MSAEDAAGLRIRARLRVGQLARHRCEVLCTELQREAAALSRRDLAGFPARVRRRAAGTVAEIDGDITAALAGLAALAAGPASAVGAPCPRPVLPDPPAARPLEQRLTGLVGVGFGTGVGASLTRLLGEAAGGPAVLVAGAAGGLAVAVWMVGARGLLQRRALLERWVGAVAAVLRTTAAQRVAIRLPAG